MMRNQRSNNVGCGQGEAHFSLNGMIRLREVQGISKCMFKELAIWRKGQAAHK